MTSQPSNSPSLRDLPLFATLAEQDKDSIEAMERLIVQMGKTRNNEEFLATLTKSIQ